MPTPTTANTKDKLTPKEKLTIAFYFAIDERLEELSRRFPGIDLATVTDGAMHRLEGLGLDPEESTNLRRIDYLAKVALRWAAFDVLRKTRREVRSGEVDDTRAAHDPTPMFESRSELAHVLRTLVGARKEDVELIAIAVDAEEPGKAIADHYGIPPASARTRLCGARKRLRKASRAREDVRLKMRTRLPSRTKEVPK